MNALCLQYGIVSDGSSKHKFNTLYRALTYSEFRKVSPGMSGGLVVGSIQIDCSFSTSAPGDA